MTDGLTPPSEPASSPSPRAFCQATGLIYQIVGFLLSIGTCCWGFSASIGGFLGVAGDTLATPTSQQAESIARSALASPAHVIWFTAAVWATFAGGLGAAATGLAMQHERRKSARYAMIVSGIMTVVFLAYLVFTLFWQPALVRGLAAGAMLALWLSMFMLAGHSNELLKRFPPPATDSQWTQSDEDALRRSASHRRRDRTNP